jgi:hypothetical protein
MMMVSALVIPAKAGTQLNEKKNWAPAFAGVTVERARADHA